MRAAIRLVERGVVPEPLLRHGIRHLLRGRLREQRRRYRDPGAAIADWAARMRSGPVAPVPDKANAGVQGKVPGTAMPVPYTHPCGGCHDVGSLLR